MTCFAFVTCIKLHVKSIAAASLTCWTWRRDTKSTHFCGSRPWRHPQNSNLHTFFH